LLLFADFCFCSLQVEAGSDIPGMFLHIKSVTEAEEGIYRCHIMAADGELSRTVLRALNLGGPDFRDMGDKYHYNILVAVIAAVVLFVPIVALCIIFQCRYQTAEQREKRKTQGRLSKDRASSSDGDKYQEQVKYPGGPGAYQNPAMSEDTTTRL
jgi:hypothetical protein